MRAQAFAGRAFYSDLSDWCYLADRVDDWFAVAKNSRGTFNRRDNWVRHAGEWVFTHNLLVFAQRVYLGLGIGVVFGLVFALIAGLTRSGEAVVDGLVQIKRAISTLALISLGILWLGIGEVMKVALIVTSVFISVYINTYVGLRGIDLRYVELVRTVVSVSLTFCVGSLFLARCLDSSRVATGGDYVLDVAGVLEQINITSGIGYLMSRARDYGQTDVMVVGLAVYVILGLVFDTVVRLLERKVFGVLEGAWLVTVHLRNLTRGFFGRSVLDVAALDLPRVEFVALIGRSVSGKSTLLRAIAGLDDEAEGGGTIVVSDSHSVLFQA